jgi:hypothetical protein
MFAGNAAPMFARAKRHDLTKFMAVGLLQTQERLQYQIVFSHGFTAPAPDDLMFS